MAGRRRCCSIRDPARRQTKRLMNHNVFVQRIMIFWTKESRGEPLASPRNLCPKSFELSATELERMVAERCYSEIVMREQDDFKPSQSIQKPFPLDKLQWPSVSVKFPQNKGAIVRYEYSHVIGGAPDRSQRPAIVNELTLNKLVRVEFNGRSSWPCGEWYYQLQVFNILQTDKPSRIMFVAEPEKQISDLADLW